MSKGSKQRPTDFQKYSENWDKIFGHKQPEPVEIDPTTIIDPETMSAEQKKKLSEMLDSWSSSGFLRNNSTQSGN